MEPIQPSNCDPTIAGVCRGAQMPPATNALFDDYLASANLARREADAVRRDYLDRWTAMIFQIEQAGIGCASVSSGSLAWESGVLHWIGRPVPSAPPESEHDLVHLLASFPGLLRAFQRFHITARDRFVSLARHLPEPDIPF